MRVLLTAAEMLGVRTYPLLGGSAASKLQTSALPAVPERGDTDQPTRHHHRAQGCVGDEGRRGLG
jgi:hypothetical protein